MIIIERNKFFGKLFGFAGNWRVRVKLYEWGPYVYSINIQYRCVFILIIYCIIYIY
jgi:hypothetical protein